MLKKATTKTIVKLLVDFVLLVVFKNTAANDIFQVICNIFGVFFLFCYDGRSTKVLDDDDDVIVEGGFFVAFGAANSYNQMCTLPAQMISLYVLMQNAGSEYVFQNASKSLERVVMGGDESGWRGQNM